MPSLLICRSFPSTVNIWFPLTTLKLCFRPYYLFNLPVTWCFGSHNYQLSCFQEMWIAWKTDKRFCISWTNHLRQEVHLVMNCMQHYNRWDMLEYLQLFFLLVFAGALCNIQFSQALISKLFIHKLLFRHQTKIMRK